MVREEKVRQEAMPDHDEQRILIAKEKEEVFAKDILGLTGI